MDGNLRGAAAQASEESRQGPRRQENPAGPSTRSGCAGWAGARPQRQLRYIEWKGVKIYDFQKVTFSTLFKLHIAGLGVLIPKRYHMLG